MEWVAGVDGCPGGWVVALEELDSGAVSSAACETFAQILELPQQPRVIAVDVPIGLLSQAQAGGRACDKEARRILGRRGSSVFSAPTRPALEALEAGLPYAAVSDANRGSSPAGIGLSKQSFAIMPKIAEVDRAVTPQLQDRVFEIHPEVSFSRANDGDVLPPKKRSAGRAAREDTLRWLGYVETPAWFPKAWLLRARADDILDACIACWTARRIATDQAQRVPEHPSLDQRSLRMEIWS
jgi:predicted RNase H-like nuclease